MKKRFGTYVKVTNMQTGEIEIFSSLAEASKHFGVCKSTIFAYVKGKRKGYFKGIYRMIDATQRQDSVLCQRLKDKKIFFFKTFKDIADFFTVSQSTIYQHCKSGKPFEGKYILTRG